MIYLQIVSDMAIQAATTFRSVFSFGTTLRICRQWALQCGLDIGTFLVPFSLNITPSCAPSARRTTEMLEL